MRICVGLSGGVDSSVAALLLKRQGHDVFAMFMQNWNDASTTLHGDCEWEEERFLAEMVARKVAIPFYFVDLSETYRRRVVDYMFDGYAHGRTPNPDVLCNREIKFDAFLAVAERYGAEAVATGHYCRKVPVGEWPVPGPAPLDAPGPAAAPLYDLLEGADPNKDQSYFLCQLTQAQLAKALFPIGELTKADVRRIAAEADLPSADRKDSQGICFVGKVDLPTFLRQQLAAREGDVIEVSRSFYDGDPHYAFFRDTLAALRTDGAAPSLIAPFAPETKVLTSDGEPLGPSPYDPARVAALSDGTLRRLAAPCHYAPGAPGCRVIGRHDGAQSYTIGQRKGLGIGGRKESLFVIGTDTASNRIYVGEGHTHPGLSRCCLRIAADEVHWLRPDLAMPPGTMRRYRVRIRYRQPLQGATLLARPDALYILFDRPQRGIAPGQFAVWYDGPALLGSGVIG